MTFTGTYYIMQRICLGSVEVWEYGSMEVWKCGSMEVWKFVCRGAGSINQKPQNPAFTLPYSHTPTLVVLALFLLYAEKNTVLTLIA
jgi:hypothetical protein